MKRIGKKKLVAGLSALMVGMMACGAMMIHQPAANVNASIVDEEALNAVKNKITETFDQEAIAKTTHQDYNNSNHRRQTKSTAGGQNVFTVDTNYSNMEMDDAPKAGAGAFKRKTTNSNLGLYYRANTDRSWLDGYDGNDFTLNFFVKDYAGTHYYEGLYSFRHPTLGWNIDVGPAGFWCNSINSNDVSDDTYRKYSNASTSSWSGRSTYNSFDNGSFRTSGTTSDKMESGRWYMITQTFSATNGLTIYRDGVKKVHYTTASKLVTNNGDPEPWTMGDVISHLFQILTTKNSRLSFFRGRSSQRTIGVCTDELTIFKGALTEDEINIWKDAYTTISYKDEESTLKTYTDVARNLIPTYTPTKEDHTFYKWATDEKLLSQMSQEMQLADYSVYADWKDNNNVSDGAKILAQDIVALDTCSQYGEAEDWNDKIDMLDNDDTNYVENYVFNDGQNDYTIRQKLDYMSQYSAAQNSYGSFYFGFSNAQDGFASTAVIAIVVIAIAICCCALLLRQKKQND